MFGNVHEWTGSPYLAVDDDGTVRLDLTERVVLGWSWNTKVVGKKGAAGLDWVSKAPPVWEKSGFRCAKTAR
jgi:formylglycine-generating enzyme required for sulfatase activity